MKKIFSVLAACVLLLCATACGDGGSASPDDAATGFVTAIYENKAKQAAAYLHQSAKDVIVGKEKASNSEVAKKLESVMAESGTVNLKEVKVSGSAIIDNKDDIAGGLEELYTAAGITFGGGTVDAVATVEVEVTGEFNGTLESNITSVYCVKMEGEWFVVYFG